MRTGSNRGGARGRSPLGSGDQRASPQANLSPKNLSLPPRSPGDGLKRGDCGFCRRRRARISTTRRRSGLESGRDRLHRMRGTRRSRTGDGAANPIHVEQADPRTKGSELLELVRTILCDEGRSLLTDPAPLFGRRP